MLSCATESTPNHYAIPKKQGVSKWIKIGVPVVLIVLAGAGVGAYFALRNKNNSSSANNHGNSNSNGNGNSNSNLTINLKDSRLAVSTDTWMQPIYPSTVSN
jgi:flagellar basal body-associated protein FliL